MKLVIAAWYVENEEEANSLARMIFWDDKLNITPSYDGIQFAGVTVKDAPND